MFNNRINSIKSKFLLFLFITLLFIYGFGSSFLYRTFGLTGYIIGRFLFALACYFWFIHFHKGNHLLTEAHPLFQKPAFSLIFLLIFVDLYMVHLFDVPGNFTALLKQDIVGAGRKRPFWVRQKQPILVKSIWPILLFHGDIDMSL